MDDSSVDELQQSLRQALDRNGSLASIKAKLRAEVHKCLREGEVLPPPPPVSNETLLVNELIREYLIFHGLTESLSVFLPETGHPQTRPFDRSFLVQHLNLVEGTNSKQLPLLYNLVSTCQAIPQTAAALSQEAAQK